MHDFGNDIDGKLVFEATTDPMAVVDTAADPAQIATVNSAFRGRFSCEQTTVRGTDLTAILGDGNEVALQSRIQPGAELETRVDLECSNGDSLLRVRPFNTEEANARSLVVITDPPDKSHVVPVGEDKTAGDQFRPFINTTRAEDASLLRNATAELLLDGFGFDAAVVDLGAAEPLMENVDEPIAVPRRDDDTSDIVEYDVADDRNSERWEIVIAESVEGWGVIQVAADASAATDPCILEGVELVSEYVGAVLDRLNREQQLRTEYEEVAIFNRILRHELLNGLNLIQARLDFLERDISSANQDHYEAVRVRVQDMIEQVEVIRELRNADEPIETEPIALADVVRDPVERAGENHPEATFSIVGPVPDLAVVVDELAQFCLRNVLRNSVQHADIDDPAVRINVEQTNGFATIRIADNGPGIPDDLDESVFGQGVSSLDGEGHGEGLFLTQRLIEDLYGGGIRVSENDCGGAEFVIELPVAGE